MAIDYLTSMLYAREYLEGRTAYPASRLDENPYPKGSVEAQLWEDGWIDAQGYEAYIQGKIDMSV
jgi:hypothetical protein